MNNATLILSPKAVSVQMATTLMKITEWECMDDDDSFEVLRSVMENRPQMVK